MSHSVSSSCAARSDTMTTDEFRATLRPENIDDLPKIYQTWSLWLSFTGDLFDAEGAHAEWAYLHSREDVEGMKRLKWARVNVSRCDGCILVEHRGRLTSSQLDSLDALRFSQGLSVVNDDGTTIFEAPEEL